MILNLSYMIMIVAHLRFLGVESTWSDIDPDQGWFKQTDVITSVLIWCEAAHSFRGITYIDVKQRFSLRRRMLSCASNRVGTHATWNLVVGMQELTENIRYQVRQFETFTSISLFLTVLQGKEPFTQAVNGSLHVHFLPRWHLHHL